MLNLKAFKRRCLGKYLKLFIAGPGDRGCLFLKFNIPLKVSSESISELERKTVGFSRKILEMVTKQHSTLPGNFFKRVCIFYSLILFYICRSGAITVQLFRDNFRQMHNYCILRAQRNNLGIYVFWKKKLLLIISDLERKTLDSMGNFLLQGCSKGILLVQKNEFWKAFFVNQDFSNFQKFQLKYLLMLSKSFFGRWLKNAF